MRDIPQRAVTCAKVRAGQSVVVTGVGRCMKNKDAQKQDDAIEVPKAARGQLTTIGQEMRVTLLR